MLGKKQRITNEEWLRAVENIGSVISEEQMERRIRETVEEIRRNTEGKKAAYAWSGGKDSLVLGKLCEEAGIKDCVLVICNLEYPEFLSWVEENKPDGLEILNTGQDLEWLRKHPGMLFPQDSSTAAKWFHVVQHNGQAKYFKKHGLDMLLLGRRRADGNYVGAGSNIYTNNQGITRYSPLSDWSHEEILAFIHYRPIMIPPIYSWPNGYLCGTHPWPARQWTGSIENGWKEVYSIDRSIVENAANYLDSARGFLESGAAGG